MLIPLTNSPRAYAWGSTTLIPALEGRAPVSEPEAEIWYGDHPGCPSHTPDGRTLDAVLAEAGEAPLPYLLKVLAAGMSLSIQAHPSRAQAAAGFARENAAGIPVDAGDRTYRDANHKPEIIVALSERFRALVGLRPVGETIRLLAALGGDGAAALQERLAGDDDEVVLRGALAWILSGEAGDVVRGVSSALASAPDGEFAEEWAVLRRISLDFPGDPGILVALLMNLVVLRRGEALFAPAGVLHAYQDGLGVELMAASDNVLRGGLTPKHIDVAELLSIVDTRPGAAPVVVPETQRDRAVFDAGVPDFRLTRIEVPEEGSTVSLTGPTIVLATAGTVRVHAASGEVDIPVGGAVFVSVEEGSIVLSGTGEAFVAEPGVK